MTEQEPSKSIRLKPKPRWCHPIGQVYMPDVDSFLEDIKAVYQKHGMSLSHEDQHGSFIVDKLTDTNVSWLNDASVSYELGKP